jgi:uncharacterized membrane protein YhhN
MLPNDRFIHGLIAFFCAHVIYVVAFPVDDMLSWKSLIVAIVLVSLFIIYLLLLRPGIVAEGSIKLLIPVALYMVIISLMVYQGILSGQPLLIAGALSFYLSDAILAWNRFVKPLRWGTYGVMTSYYFAQYCIALSVGAN